MSAREILAAFSFVIVCLIGGIGLVGGFLLIGYALAGGGQ